jgi:hypothetical protein
MLFFLCFFLPDGGEGIEKNRDGHYWGYIARKVPGGRTKVGIKGQSCWCGLCLLDVCLCGSDLNPPYLVDFLGCYKTGGRGRYYGG